MATYYVDGKNGNDNSNGNSNNPWKTLGKAERAANPGDEVRIRTAVYQEALTIRTRNTSWIADTGQKPVVDGKYHEGLFRPDGTLPAPSEGNYLPPGGSGWGGLIAIRADGVTIDGLIIRNSAGRGITNVGSNVVIRNCQIDFHYDSCITISPSSFIDNVIVENNVCTRASVRYFDPARTEFAPESVSPVMKMGRTRDGVVRNNVCAFGYGEGISPGKGSYRVVIEGNIVHTCRHNHIGFNHSVDTIYRNNLIYHLGLAEFENPRSDSPPSGITIGDEPAPGVWPNGSGGQIYNNIIVGLGKGIDVRNNADRYDTQLNGCYIGYNTIIGGPHSRVGISILENQQGRLHKDSLIENNIIYGCEVSGYANSSMGGITFRNNLWDQQPSSAMRGSGDRIGDPLLVNPDAGLNGAPPNPNTSIDPRNYQLTSHSQLAIGQASNGGRVSGLMPPAIRKDFFGAGRDNSPDIGAHEYLGVVSEITANFSIGSGQASGQVPHTVDFVDKSTAANPIVSWQWDFGDGNTAMETNPSHTYSQPGTYDVSLTVTDDKGGSDSVTQVNLITAESVPGPMLPEEFRRFVLTETATSKVLAYGTQYPDMRCILVWNDAPFHLLNYRDIDDVERSVLTAERSLSWIDHGIEPEPVDNSGLEEEAVP